MIPFHVALLALAEDLDSRPVPMFRGMETHDVDDDGRCREEGHKNRRA